MATFHELSISQLRQALQMREQIESLQQKLHALLGGTGSTPAKASKAKETTARPAHKRTMSAAGRAKIAAAQQARWAKLKDSSSPIAKTIKPAAAPKKKGGLTVEGRAKLAAAMKARWDAKKEGAPAPNAPAK